MSTEPAPTASERTFTPAQAAMITGVPQKLQLAWRHREHLPAGDGRSWTEWTHEGLCRLALLGELSDRGLPLKFARTLTEDFLPSMQSALSGALTEALAEAFAAAPGALAAEQLALVSWTEDSAFWRGCFGFEEMRAELQAVGPDGQPTFEFRSALILNLTAIARGMARRIVMIERAEAVKERAKARGVVAP